MTFQIAAGCSLLLGIFSFFLPDTPPNKKSASLASVIGLDALVLFKDRSFIVFFLTSIAICIPLAFYYSFTNAFLNDVGVKNAAGIMTLGQASEFVFLLLMPLFFRKLGIKKLMMVGILAWVARYILFAFGDSDAAIWMLYGGIVLHGICYDFFFVTGQIYIDNKADISIRNSAQGMITFATYGIGMLIGSYASGFVTEIFASSADSTLSYDWQSVWLTPGAIAVFVGLVFFLLFKPRAVSTP